MYPKKKPSMALLCLSLLGSVLLNAQTNTISTTDSILVHQFNGDTRNSSIIKVSKAEANQAANEHLKVLDLEEKISPLFEHSKTSQNIGIIFHDKVSQSLIERIAQKYQLTNIDASLQSHNIIEATIPGALLHALAQDAAIRFVDKKHQVSPLNISTKRILHHAFGARTESIETLSGKDVVIGMGDIGSLGSHIDYGCNTKDFVEQGLTGYARHADHVAGAIIGKGFLDPSMEGIATDATLLVETTTNIVLNAKRYHDLHNMTITNNSYGINIGCLSGSDYNYMSGVLDELSFQMPTSIHVFASGNSGLNNCSDYQEGYGNLLKFYGTSKNVLTVGNVDNDFILSATSSKGPTFDGRLKPEITAVGTRVHSTGPDNTYFENSGTSMSAPVVTGVLGLMTQAYKELYKEQPSGNVLKAIVCNTAMDAGLKGPDFGYGFGIVHADAAIRVIEKGHFTEGSVSGNNKQTYTLTNQETAPLKILLYWNDPKALPYAEKALVNNLDLQVIAPSGKIFYPLVADASNPTLPARSMVDTINNIEQIRIDNPEEGTYQVIIAGHDVAGTQAFAWTYTTEDNNLEITYPRTGTVLPQGQKSMLNWNTASHPNDAFTVLFKEYPTAKAQTIFKGVKSGDRNKNWFLPNKTLENASLEIINERTNERHTVSGLKVYPTISNAAITRTCGESATLSWEEIQGATAYEVAQIDCDQLKIIQTTKLPYIEFNVGFDETYFAVTPIFGTTKGIRSPAIAKPQEEGTAPCDGDVKLVNINIPSMGRALTSNSLTSKEVNILLKNLNQDAVSELSGVYTIQDTLNHLLFSNNIVPAGIQTIEAFRFPDILPGTYVLRGHIAYKDTKMDFEKKLIQLPNEPISLPFQNNFKDLKGEWYDSDKMGLDEIVRWDIALIEGEAHTYDGINLISRESDIFQTLMGTFNLDGVENADLEIAFQTSLDGAAVLEFRNTDTEVWKELGTLNEEAGIFSATLHAAFSSSTQLRIRSSHSRFKLEAIRWSAPIETKLNVFQSLDKLQWEVNEVSKVDYFIVQLEKDGAYETIDVLDVSDAQEIPTHSFEQGDKIRILAVLKNGQSIQSEPIVLLEGTQIQVANLIDNEIQVEIQGNQPVQVQLASIQGHVTYHATIDPSVNGNLNIPAAQLASGVYVLHFHRSGMQKTVRVVKP